MSSIYVTTERRVPRRFTVADPALYNPLGVKLMDIAGFADEIALEREHQAARWADGTDAKLDAVDDEKNGLLEFSMYLCRYATAWCPGGFPPYDPATLRSFRSHMIKVATLAYAATRWVDRKLEKMEAEDGDKAGA